MRIRKRQPVVVLETNPASSHLALPASAITHEGQGHFVAQNGCWPRDHKREVINKETAKQDASPVRKFVDYPQCKRSQDAQEEAQSWDYLQAETTLPRKERIGNQTGRRTTDDRQDLEAKTDDTHTKHYESGEFKKDFGRLRDIQDSVAFANEVIEVRLGDKQPSVEKDLNHPSNKPKESLLYSLYCVFSRLSGKTVLTAREALSKIIEEGLPGLDEGTGLHSVQVARVMRSNPYFVHLEGGKFLLCSGPSPQNKDQMIHDLQNSAAEPTKSQQPSTLPNEIGKRNIDEEPQDCTGMRNKRARSKSSGSSTDIRNKMENNVTTRPEESVKISASKSEISASPKIAQGDDVAVQICKRYDGRGWKCHEKALQGYSMCRHHHELIVNRLARLRNSGRLGPKKSLKRRKAGGKQVNERSCETEAESNTEQSGAQWRKNVKARSLKSINT